jgi:hypothetical protein
MFVVRAGGSPAGVSTTGSLCTATGAAGEVLSAACLRRKILRAPSMCGCHAADWTANSLTHSGVRSAFSRTTSIRHGSSSGALDTLVGSPSRWMHISVSTELFGLKVLVVRLGTSLSVAQFGKASALEDSTVTLELIQSLDGQSRGAMVNGLRVMRFLDNICESATLKMRHGTSGQQIKESLT